MMKAFLWHALVLISLVLNIATGLKQDGIIQKDDYYAKFNEDDKTHTMVKYKGIGSGCQMNKDKIIARMGPITNDEKTRFVTVHNDFRRNVAKGLEHRGAPGPQPEAANMRELVWDRELAAIAQRWAEQCPGKQGTPHHDANRKTDRYGNVGQNVFLDSRTSVPLFGSADPPLTATPEKSVTAFYNEVGNPGFDKSNIDPFKYQSKSAHYTRMMWAESKSIGCGFLMIKQTRRRIWYEAYKWQMFTVCNYGPAGNSGEKMYKIGPAGSDCPPGTTNNNGLCSPTGGTTSAETVPTPSTGETITTSYSVETVATPSTANQEATTTAQREHTTISATTTTTTTTTVATTTESGPKCPDNKFPCNSGNCIDRDWTCDGFEDCDGGDDELNCDKQ